MQAAMRKPSSKEYLDLVKAIGECKSKTEEDGLMLREIEILKERFADTKRIDPKKMKEYLLRLVYIEMLGHDASFGYIHAVKMCNESNLVLKKVGYMTTTLFLDEGHELLILIVNTLQQDLKSDNHLIVCSALNAICKLTNADTIPQLLQSVVDQLSHPKELVRKKAILALHFFNQRAPSVVAPHLPRFRQMLCDKDPSVMGAALCALHDILALDPQPHRNLVPSFVNILKQVVEHRLPKTYDYHKCPAPFIQLKILKILALLGSSDKACSENMYAVLTDMLRRGENNQIGNAILYEGVKTISSIYPNPRLLEQAAEITARFMKSSNHNLKYCGIGALASIVRINAKYAVGHQMAVIDCLEDPDDSLRSKTMQLLYKMTKPGNIEVIVERMIQYLKAATDPLTKADTVSKVIELAERYAPTNQWFISTVNEVIEFAGELVTDSIAQNLMRLVAEGAGDEDEHADNELRVLLRIVSWVLGEYGLLSPTSSAAELVKALVDVSKRPGVGVALKGTVLSAITKIVAHSRIALPGEALELVKQAANSRSISLQQHAHELQGLTQSSAETLAVALPPDSSSEKIEVDEGLSFLDGFVQEALANGAKPFVPLEDRPLVGAKKIGRVNSGITAEHLPSAAASSTSGSSMQRSSSFGKRWGPGSNSIPEQTAPSARSGLSEQPAGRSEKEQFAASLFGDVNGSSPSSVPPAAPAPVPVPALVPEPVAEPPAPSPVDLLMDLSDP
eukprot:gene10505-12428_t